MNASYSGLKKTIYPLLILGALIVIAVITLMNPPETTRRNAPQNALLTVETLNISPQSYTVQLQSYGRVAPRTQSLLISQVSGQVMSISPNFREGGFFEKGDLLLTIDARDYQADVKIAEAALMDAHQTLAEEQARSEQALNDWNRLGNAGQAPDLVLRKPQLLASQARRISAQSALDKAKLDLERTEILAPFAGRILDKQVDIGQVVAPHTQLAEIYATDAIEVRLPLRNADLAFIDLPETYRFDASPAGNAPRVKIFSEFDDQASWPGRIVRTEGTIDDNTRQLHVVAQIDDPYGPGVRDRTPLKIGQYVTARISGRPLDNALVIPNRSIYQGSYVYIVRDGLLQRRDISIAWQNETDALIKDGIAADDVLVLTSLGQVTSGVRVTIAQTDSAPDTAPELTGTDNKSAPTDKQNSGKQPL